MESSESIQKVYFFCSLIESLFEKNLYEMILKTVDMDLTKIKYWNHE